jgi:hypothetical protein
MLIYVIMIFSFNEECSNGNRFDHIGNDKTELTIANCRYLVIGSFERGTVRYCIFSSPTNYVPI